MYDSGECRCAALMPRRIVIVAARWPLLYSTACRLPLEWCLCRFGWVIGVVGWCFALPGGGWVHTTGLMQLPSSLIPHACAVAVVSDPAVAAIVAARIKARAFIVPPSFMSGLLLLTVSLDPPAKARLGSRQSAAKRR
jgi:hypothetical protein